MAIFSGKDGSLTFGGLALIRVRDWSLQAAMETLDTTDLGSLARSYTAGLKAATGSATIFYHDDNSQVQNVLNNLITTGVPKIGTFQLVWGTKKLKFDGYITTADISCATGEVMTAAIAFTMSGDYAEILL